jgi:hypothetical protein
MGKALTKTYVSKEMRKQKTAHNEKEHKGGAKLHHIVRKTRSICNGSGREKNVYELNVTQQVI